MTGLSGGGRRGLGRAAGRGFRWPFWCAVSAVLALMSGCSDDPSLRERFPTQWKTCDELFGAERMGDVREMVGSDDLTFTNQALSVSDVTKGLQREALEPYDRARGFDEYDVCGLRGSRPFSSYVYWSAVSLREVSVPAGRWRAAGPDAYVADGTYVGRDVVLVFRCDVAGAKGKQEQVLLETRVGKVRAPKFTRTFHERLVVELARSVRDAVGCVNRPDIPDSLISGT
ncbi:hypothetical protein AB0D84_27435 [Streptomyces sp. NPDC048193]|uniref:hypothetical protein n=1 Tax=unclassified Streptomyces TaxID=2593676 RepID=UPI00342E555E